MDRIYKMNVKSMEYQDGIDQWMKCLKQNFFFKYIKTEIQEAEVRNRKFRQRNGN